MILPAPAGEDLGDTVLGAGSAEWLSGVAMADVSAGVGVFGGPGTGVVVGEIGDDAQGDEGAVAWGQAVELHVDRDAVEEVGFFIGEDRHVRAPQRMKR